MLQTLHATWWAWAILALALAFLRNHRSGLCIFGHDHRCCLRRADDAFGRRRRYRRARIFAAFRGHLACRHFDPTQGVFTAQRAGPNL